MHRQRGKSMNYAAILPSVLCCLAVPVPAQIVHVWDLADTAQTGQFTVYNPDVNDAEFGTPIAAGDLDGDGRGDLVISAMAGDGPDNDRSQRRRSGHLLRHHTLGRRPGPGRRSRRCGHPLWGGLARPLRYQDPCGRPHGRPARRSPGGRLLRRCPRARRRRQALHLPRRAHRSSAIRRRAFGPGATTLAGGVERRHRR